MIEFARAWAFAALPLPVLAWYFLPKIAARGAVVVPASVMQYVQRLTGHGSPGPGFAGRLPMLQTIGWIALVTALAGPFQRGQSLIVPTGRDLVIAIDVSASMGHRKNEQGHRRIDAVRTLLARFVARTKGDRLGLIAFATEAHLVAPLTFDTGTVAEMLKELTVGLAGRRTDLGQAIGLAVKVLRAEPAGPKAIVVVSDGETNLGDLAAIDAARLAARLGAQVNVIGFSEKIGAKNTAHMREIAELTGGRFFHAGDRVALGRIIGQLERLSEDRARPEAANIRQDWTWLALIIALAMVGAHGWREVRDP